MRCVLMRLECEKRYGMTNLVLAPGLAYHKALSYFIVIQCCSDAVVATKKVSKDQPGYKCGYERTSYRRYG